VLYFTPAGVAVAFEGIPILRFAVRGTIVIDGRLRNPGLLVVELNNDAMSRLEERFYNEHLSYFHYHGSAPAVSVMKSVAGVLVQLLYSNPPGHTCGKKCQDVRREKNALRAQAKFLLVQ
jgi:hypothetical protein